MLTKADENVLNKKSQHKNDSTTKKFMVFFAVNLLHLYEEQHDNEKILMQISRKYIDTAMRLDVNSILHPKKPITIAVQFPIINLTKLAGLSNKKFSV